MNAPRRKTAYDSVKATATAPRTAAEALKQSRLKLEVRRACTINRHSEV